MQIWGKNSKWPDFWDNIFLCVYLSDLNNNLMEIIIFFYQAMNEAQVYQGTLVSRVKGAMFDVFQTNIQKIFSSSPSNIIREWKRCNEAR